MSIFAAILLVVAASVVTWLVGIVLTTVRRLNRRIRAHKEDVAEGRIPVGDPMAALGELYGEHRSTDKEAEN